jgi:hypothetical protein
VQALQSQDTASGGIVVVNYGDPRYWRWADRAGDLSPAEEVFLRLVAYAAFAEVVSVPGRYLLEGRAAAQAAVWARPLLEAGVLRPNRRAEVGSFAELAALDGLGQRAVEHAEFLDRVARPRMFTGVPRLAATFRATLLDDLAPGGPFRRALGGLAARHAAGLDGARAAFDAGQGSSPEAVVEAVQHRCPALAGRARRCAVARYYLTPALLDRVSTREVPAAAARILARGEVLDPHLAEPGGPAPMSEALQRLRCDLPRGAVAAAPDRYCEAVLELRQQLPEARQVFTRTLQRADAEQLVGAVNRPMREEFDRQHAAATATGWTFTLVTSLLGTAVGGGADLATGMPLSLGLGPLAGALSYAAQRRVQRRRERTRRPWPLAVARLAAARR